VSEEIVGLHRKEHVAHATLFELSVATVRHRIPQAEIAPERQIEVATRKSTVDAAVEMQHRVIQKHGVHYVLGRPRYTPIVRSRRTHKPASKWLEDRGIRAADDTFGSGGFTTPETGRLRRVWQLWPSLR